MVVCSHPAKLTCSNLGLGDAYVQVEDLGAEERERRMNRGRSMKGKARLLVESSGILLKVLESYGFEWNRMASYGIV